MKFGSYIEVCDSSALSICNLLNNSTGLSTKCYTRTYQWFNSYLFEYCYFFIYLIAFIMLSIILYNLKKKTMTEVIKNMIIFFYFYLFMLTVDSVTITNIIPSNSGFYTFLVLLNTSLNLSLSIFLFLTGLLNFPFILKVNRINLYIKLISLSLFLIMFLISILTIKNMGGLDSKNPSLLWFLHLLLPNLLITLYMISQLCFTFYYIENRWALGDIVIGYLFYLSGLLFLSLLSIPLCQSFKHYLDGIFFFQVSQLCSIMMCYKFIDGITTTDLEFIMLPLDLKNSLLLD
ncbi:hypothetical protein K502DRAFT_305674 [Neoconidiobolus thromboides FSU 785]|nr:hypothetical protein K502DRAFT_305674 [Neoconidiobolus thromboides FSU 785]